MKNKKEIGMYMIANYAYIGINAISNLFVSQMLGPSILGAISYFNAIDSNLNSFVLGIIRSSMEREIPQIFDDVEKKEFGEKAFTLNLILISIFSLLYLTIGVFSSSTVMYQCAMWVCVLSFIKGLYDCCRIWHKSNFNILEVSYIMLITAFAIPPIVLILSFYYSYNGFWFGRILLVLVSLAVIYKWMPSFKLKKINQSFIRHIIVSGGPIILLGFIQTVYQTFDKYIINYRLGLEELGYYSIGAMAFSMMLLLPQSFVGAIFPRFVARKDEDLKSLVFKYSTIIQLTTVALSIIGLNFLPGIIRWCLPQYEPSIPVLKMFFIGFVAYSSCQMKYVDLIRTKRIKELLSYSTIPFIISIILFCIYAVKTYNIIDMAFLTSINFFMLSTAINIAWCKANRLTIVDTIKNISIHFIFCIFIIIISFL